MLQSFPYIDHPISLDVPRLETAHEGDHRTDIPGTNDSPIRGLQFDDHQTSARSGNKFLFRLPSENRYSIKVFRNKYLLDKERERLQKYGSWIIHPCNNFRLIRDIIMVIVCAITLAITPVYIAFRSDNLNSKYVTFNCVFDLVLIFDVVINFRTGIIIDETASTFILLPRFIARQYSKTWFSVDLISSLPIDYIYILSSDRSSSYSFIYAGRALRILRICKILSTLRLLRIFRMVRYFINIERFLDLDHTYIPVINTILLGVLITHLLACLQAFVPMVTGFPENCWMNSILDASAIDQYIWSMFKALSEMLSLSTFKYNLRTKGDQLTSIVTRVTGAILSVVFVAEVVRMFVLSNLSKTLTSLKLKDIKTYMDQNNLPKFIQKKALDYYRNQYRGLVDDESTILKGLSTHLTEEIMNIQCGEMVRSASLLCASDQYFITSLIGALCPEIALPGEWIITEGTIGSKMYFVKEGLVDIITKDGEILASLADGSNFGELCLMSESIRLASARAKTHCRLYSLDRDRFQELLGNYPLALKYFETAVQDLYKNVFNNSTWKNLSQIWRRELIICQNRVLNPGSNEKDRFQIRYLQDQTNGIIPRDLDDRDKESSL